MTWNKAYDDAYKKAHKEAGLCPTCPTPVSYPFVYCTRCRATRQRANTKNKLKYKEQGKCRCSRALMKRTKGGSYIHCPVCYDKVHVSHQMSR
jgi:hypothetical protein